MTAAGQRIANLEQQVAELEAHVTELSRAVAYGTITFGDLLEDPGFRRARASVLAPVRRSQPRHLRSIAGGEQ